MKLTLRRVGVVLGLLLMVACTKAPEVPKTITAVTHDGVTIHGETHFGDAGAKAPLILLFHQGGSNGRGEYAELIPWLNQAGYRAIAWDQRSGGETYGETNRTVEGLAEGALTGYCDAYPDLQTALEHVTTQGWAKHVFVWGSSYSAALVFRLAAEFPEKVLGVLAFSPASGGPVFPCRAGLWAEDVTAPILVLRPASEMTRESSQEQRKVLTKAGADFLVVENGVHGSSMLIDSRTEQNMSEARAAVLGWLQSTHGSNNP